MSLFELLAWAIIVIAIVCWIVVAFGYAWARYCSWSIQRDRDLFWAQLTETFERRARRARERYVVPEGPYR